MDTLNDLKQLVTEIGEDIYGGFKQEALNRIRERDEKDWSIVALALVFGCPIWTEVRISSAQVLLHGEPKTLKFFSTNKYN